MVYLSIYIYMLWLSLVYISLVTGAEEKTTGVQSVEARGCHSTHLLFSFIGMKA